MAHSNMTRPLVKDRLGKWTSDNRPERKGPEFPETNLLDKARTVALGPPTKKEKKLFAIEYQWKSKEDFNKQEFRLFLKNDDYTDQWVPLRGGKFPTLVAAYSSHKTMKLSTYYDPIGGRNWRIRHLSTNETFGMI